MHSNDPQVQEFHYRAESNAKRILAEVCAKALATTPPSHRAPVVAALKWVQSEFALEIRARDMDTEAPTSNA